MAQLGQSARLGAVRSQVRILLPRFEVYQNNKGITPAEKRVMPLL